MSDARSTGKLLLGLGAVVWALCSDVAAQGYTHPTAMYMFPAGGQRGRTVEVRVGGQFLHGEAAFHMAGDGVLASSVVREIETIWFEGPLIKKPLSLKGDEYPLDHAATVTVDREARPGDRYWQLSTSQGATPARVFVVGDLPEVVEKEIEGAPLPEAVELPVTINGRIFPREDVDIWSFVARAGETVRFDLRALGLGSPLEARLLVLGPDGRHVAEETGKAGSDPRLHFTARTDGEHHVHVHDLKYAGRQDYVYRLTITRGPRALWVYPLGAPRGSETVFELGVGGAEERTVEVAAILPERAADDHSHRFEVDGETLDPVFLQTGDRPEHREVESKDLQCSAEPVRGSATLNGRIGEAGEMDRWAFWATPEQPVVLDLQAARLGSPLDSVVTVLDLKGKELARADDSGGGTDSRLEFTAPVEGVYHLTVAERFSSRGGPDFAYRLHIGAPADPFRLVLGRDALTLMRGAKASLSVSVERGAGAREPIELFVDGLPPGVTAPEVVVPPDKDSASIALEATPLASIRTSTIRVLGRSGPAEARVVRRAARPGFRGEQSLQDVLLAVALPTPFSVHRTGLYYVRAPRGCSSTGPFRIDRGGYEGPLTIRMADRQRRHLQGITGEPMVVPAGATTFEYTVQLVPRMEVSRTARVLIVAVGEIEEPDGRKHRVAYANTEGAQLVLSTTAGRLSVDLDRPSVMLTPGASLPLEVTVTRGSELESDVTVELIVPAHIRGVEAKPVQLAAGETVASLVLSAAAEAGPFNLPLTVRATARDAQEHPVFGEATVEIFWSPDPVLEVGSPKRLIPLDRRRL